MKIDKVWMRNKREVLDEAEGSPGGGFLCAKILEEMEEKEMMGESMKPFQSKVWLSSPTMHGPELEYMSGGGLFVVHK